jgi:hypothetical protein
VVTDDLEEVNHQDRALDDQKVVVVDVDENVDVANSVADHHLHYDVVNVDYEVLVHPSSFA